MKKFALLAALLLLVTGVLALPAVAQDDAHPLAQYFPASAPFYVEFRSDDEFVAELESAADARLIRTQPALGLFETPAILTPFFLEAKYWGTSKSEFNGFAVYAGVRL